MAKMLHPKSTGSKNKLDIRFTPTSWEDYLYWQKEDKKILKKINNLIKECQRDSFAGTGKPERLKHIGNNIWSRRITIEHRLVYAVDTGIVTILQCRYHY